MGRGPGPGRCHAPGVRRTGAWARPVDGGRCGAAPGPGARLGQRPVGWRADGRCRGLDGRRRGHGRRRLGQDGRVAPGPDRPRDRRPDRPATAAAGAAPPRHRAGRPRVRRRPETTRGPPPGRAEGPQAEQGHPRLHVLRRRRRPVRARLARRQLVRDDERHVLDAQPEGIRRPAQARTRVPGTRPARDAGPVLGRGATADARAGRDRGRRRRLRTSSRRSRRRAREPGAAADPHHELLVGIDGRRDRSRAGARRRERTRRRRRGAADQRTRPHHRPPDLGRAMADIGRALTDERVRRDRAAGSPARSSAGCRSRSGSAGSPAR